jgi:quinol monooxygenase YgiN
MVKVGLMVRVVAKAGKEEAVAQFLAGALPLAQAEGFTVAWFAIRVDASTFYIVDAFADDAGRSQHLTGPIAAALMANASTLLAEPPRIDKVDLLAAKLPG